MKYSVLIMFILLSLKAFSNEEKLKYKASKRMNFQSLLIEGEKKKAQFSVVTGNMGEIDLGLLKLRENFHDVMQDDNRENVQ